MAKAKTTKKLSPAGLLGQSDPRTPLDPLAFLKAAQPILEQLGEDLLERAKASQPVQEALLARHAAERAARRTAEDFPGWQRQFVEQVAAAWLLSCVFVRTLEDRGLLGHARIAGPGALDGQRLFFDMAPSLTEREYLLTVFRELSRLPAARDLFAAQHNPVWMLGPSAEGAKALLALFRQPSADAPAFRFGQPDTRFLGDLYQDLNEDVQKRFALLQTPRFVESFILERTLTPALDTFGLDETTVFDPTCGSGHFLLGAFERLVDARLLKEPGLGERVAAKKALEAVAGADINPYAVAIAKFRLTLAFLEKAGFKKLSSAPELPLHVVVADSLLHKIGAGQTSFDQQAGQSVKAWKGDEFALEDEDAAKAVLGRRYAVVVGNPPYITVKDAVLREEYRKLYPSSASGKYSLSAPFAERFFELAKPKGYMGQITANSFMKREFGKKLIEEFLPTVNLNLIVNTSGAYIPGHGTPTVLLFGTKEEPLGNDLPAVLANRGEPSTPEKPQEGLVWSSIVEHWNEDGFGNDYISVTRIDRKAIKKHPWSLGGGGASELKELLEERAEKRLSAIAAAIGVMAVTGEDEVYIADTSDAWHRRGVTAHDTQPFGIGENIRDWSMTNLVALYPHDAHGRFKPVPSAEQFLWPVRTVLKNYIFFGKIKEQRGLNWREYGAVQKDKLQSPASIAFAEVATHNHFVLDRGGRVFNRTAPIIKLPATATEDDHFALLAYLNSSTACFWMKQVCMNKGGSGIGRGVQDEAWEGRFQFDATKVGTIVLPHAMQDLWRLAKAMEDLATGLQSLHPSHVIAQWTPHSSLTLTDTLAQAIALGKLTLARMCALQEEIDWLIYERFDLLSKTEKEHHQRARAEALPDFPRTIDTRHKLHPGHRPFEVVLARKVLSAGTKTAWFERNGYASPSEIRDTYAPSYQRLLETRIALIDQNPQIALVEQPEYKRRWTLRDYDAETDSAARTFLLDAVEKFLCEAVEVRRADHLAADALRDPKTQAVVELLTTIEPKKLLSTFIAEESVPFLSAYRYTDTGLEKRDAWERTWDLQRQEDAGHFTGDIPVPPKYDSSDYRDPVYWRHRGKLDVPKERFIAYPGCESSEDQEPVYGWAGWNHLQQAQALATLYQKRRTEEDWKKERLVPLLAGLVELVPWVKQWHNLPNDEYGGLRLGDYFDTFLDAQCRELGVTREELRAWRPEAKKRGKGGGGRKRGVSEE